MEVEFGWVWGELWRVLVGWSFTAGAPVGYSGALCYYTEALSILYFQATNWSGWNALFTQFKEELKINTLSTWKIDMVKNFLDPALKVKYNFSKDYLTHHCQGALHLW